MCRNVSEEQILTGYGLSAICLPEFELPDYVRFCSIIPGYLKAFLVREFLISERQIRQSTAGV